LGNSILARRFYWRRGLLKVAPCIRLLDRSLVVLKCALVLQIALVIRSLILKSPLILSKRFRTALAPRECITSSHSLRQRRTVHGFANRPLFESLASCALDGVYARAGVINYALPRTVNIPHLPTKTADPARPIKNPAVIENK